MCGQKMSVRSDLNRPCRQLLYWLAESRQDEADDTVKHETTIIPHGEDIRHHFILVFHLG